MSGWGNILWAREFQLLQYCDAFYRMAKSLTDHQIYQRTEIG